MRLTLRTLLAYLDDTLEPAQAKAIGQKVAESDQARELIERIRQVTRRRRITTPPSTGPGSKIDPNTVGEYLDNVIAPEEAAELEEIGLASDTHLAEIAACHQILTLILGEPALVPPSARQRMYGLVKGPEAIPFRKPPVMGPRSDIDMPEGRDVDDTLRLGIPPVSGRDRGNPWLLIPGVAAAACLLAFAVWQILKAPDDAQPTRTKSEPVVQVDPNKDKPPPSDGPKKKDEDKKEAEEPGGKKEEKKDSSKEPAEIKLPPVVVDVGWTKPNTGVQPLAQLISDVKEPALLLHYVPDKMEWRRIGPKNQEVSSGRTLVSLPASKSVLQLGKGLKVTLVGSISELFYVLPLYESMIELHAHEQLDLDMTLRRGRVRIAAGERPARVRIRFDNPTQPSQHDFFDIALQSPGTEVLVDRWFGFPPNERFYRNPKDPNRVGPYAGMACVVISGSVLLKAGDVSRTLSAPPGPALIAWSSLKGLDQPVETKTLPEGITSYQPLPQGVDSRVRTDILRARDDLHQSLSTKAVDVTLAEGLKSPDLATRRLACVSLGAIDDLATLVEQLEQTPAPDLRLTAIEVLRNWIAAGRDHEHKLYEVLKTKYRAFEAENIVSLLHDPAERDLTNPDTFDLLISYLNHPQLPMRELARWHLVRLAPAGQKIPYNPTADAATRQQAQAAWRALIAANQPPAAPMKTPAPMKK
jgi:hypothetical protein